MAGKHRKDRRHCLHPDRTPVKRTRLSDYFRDHRSKYDDCWPSVPFRLCFTVSVAFLVSLPAIAGWGVTVVPPDPVEAVTVASVVQTDVPMGCSR